MKNNLNLDIGIGFHLNELTKISMEDSKVVHLLKSLDNQELNEFGRYINTDFFNRKESVKNLYKELKSNIKNQKQSLVKRALFSKIFPKESKSKGIDEKKIQKKMDSVMYDLKNLLEDYLIMVKMRQPTYDRDKFLLEIYKERDVDQFFFMQHRKMEQALEKSKNISTDFYLKKYELLRQLLHHPRTHHLSDKVLSVEQSLEYLDRFYCSNKLHHAWIIMFRSHIATVSQEIDLLPELIHLVEEGKFGDDNFTKLNYLGVRSILNKEFNMETFQQMKDLAFELMPNLHHRDKLNLISLLINYCTYLIYITNSPTEVEKNSYEIIKYAHESQLLLEKGFLTYGAFFNFVIQGCRVGDFDYVDKFISDNQKFLKEDMREPTVQISKAFMFHRIGKPELALDFLNAKQVFINVNDKTYEKIIRISCYFDLDEVNLLENALEAFRKYITRQKDIEEFLAKRMLKFSQFVRQIYSNKHDKDVLLKLYHELDNAEIVQKSWVKHLLEELLGSRLKKSIEEASEG